MEQGIQDRRSRTHPRGTTAFAAENSQQINSKMLTHRRSKSDGNKAGLVHKRSTTNCSNTTRHTSTTAARTTHAGLNLNYLVQAQGMQARSSSPRLRNPPSRRRGERQWRRRRTTLLDSGSECVSPLCCDGSCFRGGLFSQFWTSGPLESCQAFGCLFMKPTEQNPFSVF